jgi:hypothetical protein
VERRARIKHSVVWGPRLLILGAASDRRLERGRSDGEGMVPSERRSVPGSCSRKRRSRERVAPVAGGLRRGRVRRDRRLLRLLGLAAARPPPPWVVPGLVFLALFAFLLTRVELAFAGAHLCRLRRNLHRRFARLVVGDRRPGAGSVGSHRTVVCILGAAMILWPFLNLRPKRMHAMGHCREPLR